MSITILIRLLIGWACSIANDWLVLTNWCKHLLLGVRRVRNEQQQNATVRRRKRPLPSSKNLQGTWRERSETCRWSPRMLRRTSSGRSFIVFFRFSSNLRNFKRSKSLKTKKVLPFWQKKLFFFCGRTKNCLPLQSVARKKNQKFFSNEKKH